MLLRRPLAAFLWTQPEVISMGDICDPEVISCCVWPGGGSGKRAERRCGARAPARAIYRVAGEADGGNGPPPVPILPGCRQRHLSSDEGSRWG